MSAVISSAVGGKKAAPKAPARRRAAPPPAPPPKPTTAPTTSDSLVVVPDNEEGSTSETTHPTASRASTTAHSAYDPDSDTDPSTAKARATPPVPAVQEKRVRIEEPTRDPVESRILQELPRQEPAQPPRVDDTDASQTEKEGTTLAQASRKRKQNSAPAQRKPPAKRQKKSSARSNATVQAEVNGDEATATSSRMQIDPALTGDNQEETQSRSRTTRKPRRTPKSAAIVTEADEDMTEEQLLEAARAEKSRTGRRKGRPRKSQQQAAGGASASAAEEEVSPEELKRRQEAIERRLEAHVHNPDAVSIWQLSRDAKHGKVSNIEREMRKIDWAEVRRRQQEEYDRIRAGSTQSSAQQRKKGHAGSATNGDVVETTEGADGTDEEGSGEGAGRGGIDGGERETPANEAIIDAAATTQGVPQFKMVNGQIVVEEDSLDVAEPTNLSDEVPVVEENNYAHRVNRGSYINARRRDPQDRVPPARRRGAWGGWSEDDTDRFYDALRSWGTDFDIISRLFEGKSRAQIKTKFNREEKFDPARINAALLGDHIEMDIESYALEAGVEKETYTKYESMAHAEALIAESMKEREVEMQALVDQENEDRRQAELAVKAKQEAKKKAKEKKKELTKRKRGKKGIGTMGGGDPEPDEDPQPASEAAAGDSGGGQDDADAATANGDAATADGDDNATADGEEEYEGAEEDPDGGGHYDGDDFDAMTDGVD
ncbi:Transcription factor TFIIIB component B'' [Teratosphaeria destructans]|uniref:Transcription factor TFIIIB component B n=1 Tax=Teratosphaeria destructans TaxID=418781 RepID=A0A9W7SJF8_9PEZI|nr:Transcription factor TFIIIB component B'' [Teratosphaeria destructans]